ncbi:alpha/beta hydrolase [Prescottella defluvii]|uniref:alpha/beta hydrolase n=1 Tax=Prescottella defluvii TaxID=1323361 RepID=UPI001E5AD475|nr:alpha/beta hydrolase [Prescottella defluvii]
MTRVVRDNRSELDPVFQAVTDAVAGAGLPPMVELGPEGARERIRGALQSCAPGPQVASVTTHAVNDQVTARLYRPETVRAETTVVHFHGGGWVTGDLDYSDAICRLMAQVAGVPVVSVDYRLAPEAPFPAAVDDAVAALRWVARGGEGLPRRIVVTGDSAGGNLAAVCANLAAADDDLDVAGQVLIYPVVDVDLTRASYREHSGIFLGAREMQWFLDHYCPDRADRISPLVAPIRAQDLSTTAPAVVIVGGHDPLLDEGVEYAERLSVGGVAVELLRYPTLPHGFLQFTAVSPIASEAAQAIAAAVARLVENPSAQQDSISGGKHA